MYNLLFHLTLVFVKENLAPAVKSTLVQFVAVTRQLIKQQLIERHLIERHLIQRHLIEVTPDQNDI